MHYGNRPDVCLICHLDPKYSISNYSMSSKFIFANIQLFIINNSPLYSNLQMA